MTRILVSAIGVCLVVAMANPAYPATKTFHDPKGDAIYHTWIDDETTSGSWGLDIKALKIQYPHKRLRAVVKFYSLRKVSWDEVDVLLKTSRHVYRLETDNKASPPYESFGTGVYSSRYGGHRVCNLSPHV